MGRLRLLYSSNAPWAASGYGVQGRSLLPRLAELPEFGSREAISIFAWYGLQGGQFDVDGFKVFPAGVDAYGNDVIGAHTRQAQANIVITLIDVWVLQQTAERIAPALWLPWLPIDHDPVPQRFLDALAGAYIPLTYSKWGQETLRKAGVANHYIPHGIEPTVFRVAEDEGAVRAWRQETFPDVEHLTVMVAANKGFPDRKAFQVQMRAWAAFAKDKPGAKLYIHTEAGTRYGGVDLPALARALGVEVGVIFPEPYAYYLGFPAEWLGMLYNAADVLLGASMSEGFGIPLIEAQACGCPVVTTDASAMPELVRWGMKVAPADVVWTPMNSWQWWPDVRGIEEALGTLYAQWEQAGRRWPRSQRLRAQKAIHDEYSWDAIVREHWAPLMAKLANVAPEPVAGAATVRPVQQSNPQRSSSIVAVAPVEE